MESYTLYKEAFLHVFIIFLRNSIHTPTAILKHMVEMIFHRHTNTLIISECWWKCHTYSFCDVLMLFCCSDSWCLMFLQSMLSTFPHKCVTQTPWSMVTYLRVQSLVTYKSYPWQWTSFIMSQLYLIYVYFKMITHLISCIHTEFRSYNLSVFIYRNVLLRFLLSRNRNGVII